MESQSANAGVMITAPWQMGHGPLWLLVFHDTNGLASLVLRWDARPGTRHTVAVTSVDRPSDRRVARGRSTFKYKFPWLTQSRRGTLTYVSIHNSTPRGQQLRAAPRARRHTAPCGVVFASILLLGVRYRQPCNVHLDTSLLVVQRVGTASALCLSPPGRGCAAYARAWA